MDFFVRDRLGSEDHGALLAACSEGVGLCTVVGIEGGFSRRIGAQLAILPDGAPVGSLADGCLEAQLAADMSGLDAPRVLRYGRGSSKIDFRLPCGGGLDILLDPAPSREACRRAIYALENRAVARLELPCKSPLSERRYIPDLRIVALGEGPELASLDRLARAAGYVIDAQGKDRLSLGVPAAIRKPDPWTAVVLLFHDHEWEEELLEQAVASEAFYIGAQGGERARIERTLRLAARGLTEEQIARIRSPIGAIPSCKTPSALALSALAEIVGEYERLLEFA